MDLQYRGQGLADMVGVQGGRAATDVGAVESAFDPRAAPI
jgi:hypothetical protein